MSRNAFSGFKPIVAFVLGAPGSGKGTQCKLICEEFGFAHLSAGELLREEQNSPNSQYGEMIEKHIVEGSIVPVEVTCSLIEKAMIKHCQELADKHKDSQDKKKLTGKFLVDGFPRNIDNLQGWNSRMSVKVNEAFVLFLDCPTEICVQRCIARGREGSKRTDDNEKSLRKRLVTYKNATMPIIEHYAKLDMVRKFDAVDSPQEVYEKVRKIFIDL